MGRAGSLLVAVLLAVLAFGPSRASAHASLERSDPINDVVLQEAPKDVTLTFTEAVESSLGAVRIFDGDAKAVAVGDPVLVRANVVRAPITGSLTTGTYTVAWRVVSADGHPVNGAFVFHVGKRGANPGGVIGEISDSGPSGAITKAASVARFLNLALLLLLVGAVFTIVVLIRGALPDVRPKMWLAVSGAGFALSVAAAATIVLQGATVRGLSFGGAARGGVLSAVLDTQFGKARLVELILAEIVAIAAVWAASAKRQVVLERLIVAATAGIAVTPAFSGHASVRGPLAIVLDSAHVAVAAIWVGGLAAVALALALSGTASGTAARQVLPRYSAAALVSVGVLVLTGSINGIIELGAITRLWTTTYGGLLLAKIVMAVVLIGFGIVNRRLLASMATSPDPRPLHLFRRSIIAELAVMLLVVGVTSQLISKPPARATATSGGPQTATTTAGDLTVRIVVDPARSGPNVVHVYLSKDRASVDADEVRVAATLGAANLGPISAPATRTEPGHYVGQGLPLSAAGTWTITAAIRRGEFDQVEATVSARVRDDDG